MIPFEDRCACYAIHSVHRIPKLALAKALKADIVMVGIWVSTSSENREVHGEASKLGM